MVKKIAIYGKGGIGKSVIGQNITAAAALLGYKTMLIGCDPKCDSTIILTHGKKVETVLNLLKKHKNINTEQFLKEGFGGVKCIEVGGPTPGVGCAGRGIIVAVEAIRNLNLLNDLDLVVFDVPGDVVCGGFAVPIRKGFSEEVYIVTSSEYLSILAANNICKGLKELKASLAGIIGNSRSITENSKMIPKFAKKIGSSLISHLPYSEIIKKCEKKLITIFENDLENDLMFFFKNLAKKIINNQTKNIPNPLSDNELRELFKEGNKQF
ncbi:MAG: P-loop NTPase [Candidatus Helarchaeota archaeon]